MPSRREYSAATAGKGGFDYLLARSIAPEPLIAALWQLIVSRYKKRVKAVCMASSSKEQTTTMPQLNYLEGVPILVLDDDPDSLALLTFVLKTEGAVVSAADCVAAAQTSFLAQSLQLVVSDIAMSGTTGYDLIAWLRALSPTAGGQVPALALTAMASSAVK